MCFRAHNFSSVARAVLLLKNYIARLLKLNMLSTIARCARGVLAKRPIAARLNPASMFDPFNRAPAIISPTFGVNSRGMANHRHKKVIKLAKGYFGRGNRCYRIAKQRVMKARQYAYRDRKV